MTVFFYSGITSYPGVSTEEKTKNPPREMQITGIPGLTLLVET